MFEWFNRLPVWLRLGFLGASALVSAFNGRLPDQLQDAGLYGGLSLFAVVFAAMAWHYFQERWRFRWPIARLAYPPTPPQQTAAPTPAPSKHYSKTDKDRLSDLYGELSQLLLTNGANGSGGFYKALADVGNAFRAQCGSFFQGLDFNADNLLTRWQEAHDASVAMHIALYGERAIVRKSEYVAYGDEIRSVLRDGSHTHIQMMQEVLNEFGNVLRTIKTASKHNDRRLVEQILEATAAPVTNYSNKVGVFQNWAFEANQRIQAARNQLRE